MRHTGTHLHHCSNKASGCKSTYACSNEYLEYDPDGSGHYCRANPMNDKECLECDSSRCSECGAIRALRACEEDCPRATQV